MSALQLIRASESRAGGSWSADDFDVVLVDSGERIGRIYARTSAGMGHPDWWWGLAFPHTLNARQPFYGLAESKDAAKRAFAERWRG
ncbi:hypothetical protein [Pseudorhodoplanes sp.]|uniref:hypothetical protein n=1 Tax=Pseudorhodoplanes sp. TaxID=1934341 RepID=UPI003D0C3BED